MEEQFQVVLFYKLISYYFDQVLVCFIGDIHALG